MNQSLVLGIDVGAQTAKLGVVDTEGHIICQTTINSQQRYSTDFVHDASEAAQELMDKTTAYGKVHAIGIGAPNGNYYKGTMEFAPNVKWCYDEAGQPTSIELARLINERIGLPVKVTNDANAAAVGEMTYGVARGLKNFIMITLGTGVGSGIVIDGKIVYGHDGFAGELGHTITIRGGRKCSCGRCGCLETYCSARGVVWTAQELLAQTNRSSLLQQIDPQRLSSKDVYDAAKKGDALAVDVLKQTGHVMGEAFADFVAFSAPEAIVLFGGVARAKEFLHTSIMNSMNAMLLPMWKHKIRVLYSTLKESNAAILGASAIAWEAVQ